MEQNPSNTPQSQDLELSANNIPCDLNNRQILNHKPSADMLTARIKSFRKTNSQYINSSSTSGDHVSPGEVTQPEHKKERDNIAILTCQDLKKMLDPLVEKHWKSFSIRLPYMLKLERISSSEIGKVWKVYDAGLRKCYALKKIKRKYFTSQKAYERIVNNEINHSLEIFNTQAKSEEPNPSLLQIYLISISEDTNVCSIVMEISKGTLEEYSAYRRFHGIEWDEKELEFILWNLIDHVSTLRDLNFYHRDIKPASVIINDQESKIKLYDFGCACIAEPGVREHRIAGSTFYMAPELLEAMRNNGSVCKYDPYLAELFSVGMTIVKLVGLDLKRQTQEIKLDDLTDKFFPNLAVYLKGLLSKPEERRKTVQKILEKEPKIKKWSKIDKKGSSFEYKRFLFQRMILMAEKKGKKKYSLCFKMFDPKDVIKVIESEIKRESENSDQALKEIRESEWKLALIEAYMRNNQYEEGLTQADGLLQFINNKVEDDKFVMIRANLFIVLGKAMDALTKYRASINYFGMSLKILKDKLGETNQEAELREIQKEIATVYWHIANVCIKEGKCLEAKNILSKSLEISRKNLLKANQLIVDIYVSIGLAWEQEGRLNDAVDAYIKARDISINLYGDLHPVVAEQSLNIGKVYLRLSRCGEAAEQFEKATDIHYQYYDEKTIDLAVMYNKIASYYEERYMIEEAHEYLEKSEAIYEDKDEEESSEKEAFYYLLGNLLAKKGRYAEALENFFQLKQIKEDYFGERHPQLVFDYAMIIQLSAMLGRPESTEIVQNIKSMKLELFEENKDIHICYLKIASGLLEYNHVQVAKKYTNKVFEFYQKLQGEDHSILAMCYENLAEIDSKERKYSEAIEKLKMALELEAKNPIIGKCRMGFIYNSLGKVYQKLGNYEEALYNFEKSLETLKNFLAEDIYVIGSVLLDIAAHYKSQGKVDLALRETQKALEIYSKHFDEYDYRVKKCNQEIKELEQEMKK